MATTKRSSPPKLVDDLNVAIITEHKTEKTSTETAAKSPKAAPAKATAAKKATGKAASSDASAATAKDASAAAAVKTSAPPTAPTKEAPQSELPKKTLRPGTRKTKATSEDVAIEASRVIGEAKTPDVAEQVSKQETTGVAGLSEEEIYHQIAEAAYYLAEKRSFQPGHEKEDWETATAEVMARLKEGS